jgi:membrane protein DedA with SNARE-associated domain
LLNKKENLLYNGNKEEATMETIVQHGLQWIANLGYFGIIIGFLLQVIPSEIILGYGGYLIAKHQITFPGAVLAAVTGSTLGHLTLYAIGYFGGRTFFERYGNYLRIKPEHLQMAEDWFRKRGTHTVFTARFLPIVGHAISIPAGMARIPLSCFVIYTALAITPWSVLFLYLGWKLGENWRQIKQVAVPYIQAVWLFVATVLLISLLLARLKRCNQKQLRSKTKGS